MSSRRTVVLVWVTRGLAMVSALVLALAPLFDQRAMLASVALICLALVVGVVAISRRDAVSILTVIAACLLLIPSNQVLVGPLNSFGNPAQLAALGALALWAAARTLGLASARRGHPVRWVMLGYLAATLTAYAAADARVLSAEELASTTRWLLISLSLIGIVMLTVDGVETPQRVEDLLVRVTVIAGLAALIGAIEYFGRGAFRWSATFQLPGFVGGDLGLGDRGDFTRIAASASHPIEYSVVMGALAPVALHLALWARTERARRWCRLSVLGIIFVTPLALSRSGLVALGVGLGFYFFALGLRGRVNFITLALLGLATFQVAVPGLISTFRYFFTAGEEEASISGRTSDYVLVPQYLDGSVVFGRGLGTFVPQQYWYLDNQYLLTLLEGGIVGLATLLGVILVAIGCARGARHRSSDPAVRGLGQALAGTIAALGATLALFDGLSFRQLSFTLFLMIGCAGALWGSVRDNPRRFPDGRLRPEGLEPDLLHRAAGVREEWNR